MTTSSDLSRIESAAAGCGFEAQGTCAASELAVRPEVRDMCASGTCRAYGHSWACPPACGDIGEYEAQMHAFDRCVVVQTVVQLEDEFDFEGMVDAEKRHKGRFATLVEGLAKAGMGIMALAAGTCTLCAECTYPDAPCRFPDKRMVSMEAAGLLVSEVCEAAGIPYNHGKNTLAYTSCVLV